MRVGRFTMGATNYCDRECIRPRGTGRRIGETAYGYEWPEERELNLMSEKQVPPLFDEAYYRGAGPQFEGDAYKHYLSAGWTGSRDPHPLFDVEYYAGQVAEGSRKGTDPLTHFLTRGWQQGLDPHPAFDCAHYMSQAAHELGGQDPLTHYLTRGWRSGLDPHRLFWTKYYLETNPDVAAASVNPLLHYVTNWADGAGQRQPYPQFDSIAYGRRRLRLRRSPLADLMFRLRTTRLHDALSPQCSIIVLNFNRSMLTLQAVADAMESDGADIEVVVVDNGSDALDFDLLASFLPRGVKTVRLQNNRYFGEGNNIGVEASCGQYVMLLNNDAFLAKTTVRDLLAVFDERTDAGAVGPKFLYPDGRIQEAGASVTSCGTVTQRGKYLADHPQMFAKTEAVDYVSAACVVLPRQLYDEIGGFDLAWDPAYYEDVDLCLKLRSIGKLTYYCGVATVTHIENATSSDSTLGLALNTIVEVNREKFIARWGAFLESPSGHNAVRMPAPASTYGKTLLGLAVLFTPYPLIPGGGERYLLTMAQALSRTRRTVLVTPERYSTYRLRTIARELELDLSCVELASKGDLSSLGHCDIFIAMGNEILPQVAAIGQRSIYVCQFPFPMHPNHVAEAWGRLEGYDAAVVYSKFVERNYLRAAREIGESSPAVTILAAPVPNKFDLHGAQRVAGRIMSVGRFASGGHCKRQDTLVSAFRNLVEAAGRDDLELHLVGTVGADPDTRQYLAGIRRMAAGYPVYFHLNAPPSTVRHLYQSSTAYWHAAGYGVWEHFYPERLEHFGISVIEAMSAGTVPFACANGGPTEVITDGVNGFTWGSPEDLTRKTLALLSMSSAQLDQIRWQAAQDARPFGEREFERQFHALLDKLGVPSYTSREPSREYILR